MHADDLKVRSDAFLKAAEAGPVTSSTRRTWAVPAAFATMSHLGRCR
jgi:hypothetical protein